MSQLIRIYLVIVLFSWVISSDPIKDCLASLGSIQCQSRYNTSETICVPKNETCNGVSNCTNFLDETKEVCGFNKCNATQFQCAYGACIPASKVCDLNIDCRDHSDETSCDQSRNTTCPRKNQIRCQTVDECIWSYQRCDGQTDCLDHSDESYEACYGITCEPESFQCTYGACLPSSARCDDRLDCADGSDEIGCPKSKIPIPNNFCVPGRMQCGSGLCIKEGQICDGIRHCNDGSDETYARCFSRKCSPDQFQCSYGACVPIANITCDSCVDKSSSEYELVYRCGVDEDEDSYFAVIADEEEERGEEDSVRSTTPLAVATRPPLAVATRPPPPPPVLSEPVPYDYEEGERGEPDNRYHLTEPPSSTPSVQEAMRPLPLDPNLIADIFEQVMPAFNPSTETPLSSLTPLEINTITSTPAPPNKNLAKKCVYPPQPSNGHYEANKKTPDVDPRHASKWTVLNYECNDGYVINGEEIIVCKGKKWNHPPPVCALQCPPIESDKHDITCTYNKREIDCDEPFEGVVANVKCKEAFEVDNLVLQPFNGIRCHNGAWSHDLFNCEPECGTIIPKGQALVIKGYKATRGEFPWHAGIYRNMNETYDQKCGGTLIAEKVVVSAAHCFWDWDKNKPSTDPNEWGIAVGKFYRKWQHVDDHHAQHFQVKSVILPPKFRADENSFANDIAVIILNDTVKFNALVRPVCLDWSDTLSKILLKPGTLGSVVGWGLTEEFGLASEELQAVQMPFIDYDQCIDESPNNFRPFVTNDKICAGYRNGTSICQGDSGGGLAFRKSNRYFIQGVVSVAPAKGSTCDSFKYVAFTNIGHHLKWIEDCELNYLD